MKHTLLFALFLGPALYAQCQVTCTRLEGPEHQVEFYWYDASPGQCTNGESCVPGCEGGCAPFCREEEVGQSKPGLCVVIPERR